MSSERVIHIPGNRRKVAGVKHLIHQEKLKCKPNQTSNSNNENKCVKVKTKESTGSEILINKDKVLSNKIEIKKGNCTKNNEVEIKVQQISDFEKNTFKKFNELQTPKFENNTAIPPLSRNARKRKRRRRAVKNNEFHDYFELEAYTEDFLSNNISSKNTMFQKACQISPPPTSTDSDTNNNNPKVRAQQFIPFSMSDNPNSVLLEPLCNNLPLPLISSFNLKGNVLGDKNSTILSNNSTKNMNNNTILISSNCKSNAKNVLNVESNVSVLKPDETIVTLTEKSESSKCDSICNGITSSQPLSSENLLLKAKNGKLKTDISLPILINILDTLEEENSGSNLPKPLPKSHSETPNFFKRFSNHEKKFKIYRMENQNSESEFQINGRHDLHNTNTRPEFEYTSSQKKISDESESGYVTSQCNSYLSTAISTKFLDSPVKDCEVVLDSDSDDDDATLITSKQTSKNLHQEIFLQNKKIRLSSSQNLDASYHKEYLNEESKVCIEKIVKVVARHYKVSLIECFCILQTNSFNIFNAMQELQLKR